MNNNIEENFDCVIIEPPLAAKRSVIWLHGLGADGNDFVPIVPELHLPSSLSVRFIFPHAPIMPVTLNNGYEMRSWFDIYSLSRESEVDMQGITASIGTVNQLIAAEVARGIPTQNIVLAGFSQGGVIALLAGLSYPKQLGGILALSTYLPISPVILQNANAANRQIPIFIAHGTQDPVLPYALGEGTAAFLRQAHYPISWHSYPMPHSVCPDEIKDISDWLQTVAFNQQ